MITAEFLAERLQRADDICGHYSRRSLMDGLPEKGITRFSCLPQEAQGLNVTNYIVFPKLILPELRNETDQSCYAEYLFSDEGLLMRKILHKEKERLESYYIYEKDRHIRLTWQDNSFRELHCVCYDNGALTEVFTQNMHSHLSGEVYESCGNRIISAESYRDYIPELPALIRREIQGIPVVMNPIVTRLTVDYDAGVVRTANPKEFANGKNLPELLTEYAQGKSIDRYLLW